jgi:putative hemolysin
MPDAGSNQFDGSRLVTHSQDHYVCRLALDAAEIQAAQSLRFEVFNLELKEGLAESFASGLDIDPFDAVCAHVIVEHTASNTIVGTYRMQTGVNAAKNLGYYSAQEFDFAPFESVRGELIELGRACVHRLHRNLVVLGLLWKGIADYARQHGARYLIGCSSLSTQDAAIGASMYAQISQRHLAPPSMRTVPVPGFECPLAVLATDPPKVPKLLSAYLKIGATICGPPAVDQHFKTIDFLTLMDIENLSATVRERFFS